MRALFKDLSPEEKAKVYARTERYRAKNPELYREAANKHYHANKEKCAERARKWRNANKQYRRDQQRERKRERKLWAIQYLGGKCRRCSAVVHPAAFDLHHRNAASKADRDPSKMLQFSLSRLTAELDKCDLLCANCHRVVHYEEKK